jgi:hypothetical protein
VRPSSAPYCRRERAIGRGAPRLCPDPATQTPSRFRARAILGRRMGVVSP